MKSFQISIHSDYLIEQSGVYSDNFNFKMDVNFLSQYILPRSGVSVLAVKNLSLKTNIPSFLWLICDEAPLFSVIFLV